MIASSHSVQAALDASRGIHAGYELVENVARPGAEEQIDNEKYQYRDRRWREYEPDGPRAGSRRP
jgi:starch synthase (maltosyl-transferring)